MRFFVLLLGSLLAAAAQAQIYLGAGLGRSSVSIPSTVTTVGGVAVASTEDTTHDTAWKLYVGYQFTPNWGLEAGFNDLGRFSAQASTAGGSAPVPTKADNWYLAGTGTIQVSNDVSLLAKAGMARNRIASGQGCIGASCVELRSDRRSHLMLGVGAQYAFTKNFGLRLEYENYGNLSNNDVWNNSASGAVRGDAVNLSLRYSFQ